jgi:hypothetical protein
MKDDPKRDVKERPLYSKLEQELCLMLDRVSSDNGNDTRDSILSTYLSECWNTFDRVFRLFEPLHSPQGVTAAPHADREAGCPTRKAPVDEKIVVPEGMMKAVMDDVLLVAAFNGKDDIAREILRRALLWLSENPIVPSDKQWLDCWATLHPPSCKDGFTEQRRVGFAPLVCAEWQRRMFLASEEDSFDRDCGDWLVGKHPQFVNAMREAYERGRKSKP